VEDVQLEVVQLEHDESMNQQQQQPLKLEQNLPAQVGEVQCVVFCNGLDGRPANLQARLYVNVDYIDVASLVWAAEGLNSVQHSRLHIRGIQGRPYIAAAIPSCFVSRHLHENGHHFIRLA
jgi:hypothetical protein